MARNAKSEQIGVFLTAEDKDDLEELAYQRRTNMAQIARSLIQEELDEARADGEIEH